MNLNYDRNLDLDSMDISDFQSSLALSPPPVLQAASLHRSLGWCTVHYYEMNNRIGSPFIANNPSFIVDGFTDPNSISDRFCLGLLSNLNRDSTIELTRRHIGRGVRIYKQGPAVYAECLSNAAIFIQSATLSKEYGFRLDNVYKVTSGNSIKIFNNQTFHELLENSVSEGFEAVYELQKTFPPRISFVKGWGPDYKRQQITSTPCWIEIQINSPLTWMDRILIQLGSSGAQCSSMS